ncbi:MAG: RNA methyltransferase [Fibrobacter sp.]|nr:RNA methyltransferase [Fibrobacter sp.]
MWNPKRENEAGYSRREDHNRSGERGERRYGAPRDNRDRPRYGTPRPKSDSVSLSMGDADAAPQVAVGGIREVEELLTKEPNRVHRVLFLLQSGNPKLYTLQKLAKKANVHVQQVDARILDGYARPNQGIVALCHEKEVLSWEAVKQEFLEAPPQNIRKLVAVVTNIEDPRNLGACIRSSLALGVDILLMPAKGMCGLTPSVARASAGALEKLRVCRPSSLEEAIAELKRSGFQILGLDAENAVKLTDFEFKEQAIIAVGGEDQGLPPFVRKQCDAVLRIPMKPEAHSYNASVALSLGLYEFARKRLE